MAVKKNEIAQKHRRIATLFCLDVSQKPETILFNDGWVYLHASRKPRGDRKRRNEQPSHNPLFTFRCTCLFVASQNHSYGVLLPER